MKEKQRSKKISDSGDFRLPPITQQPIEHIDGTPNDDYPIRILKAYRQNCNCYWEVHGLPKKEALIYEMMNEHQRQRAKLLDKAIRILEKAAVS